MENKQKLPNATTVLVLGMCSLAFSCFIIGMVIGIIGIVMAGQGRRMYKADPEKYEGYGPLHAGYILSIIGTILGAMCAIYLVVVVVIFGGAAYSIFEAFNPNF